MKNTNKKSDGDFSVDVTEDFAVLQLDAKGNIKTWNKGAEKIKGYKPDEIIGKNFSIFYSQEDCEKLLPQKLMKSAIDNGKAAYEGWRIRKDGTAFWADISLTTLYGPAKNIVGFSVITHDHTKNKQEIDFDHCNLQALINNTSDLMWSVDTNYKLITSNNAFDNEVKKQFGKIIQKGDSVLEAGSNAETYAKFKQYYDWAFAGHTFTEIEFDKSPLDQCSELSFHPIRKDGDVIGTACFSHDITERKITETKLKNSEHRFRSLVENSADALGIFSAGGELIYVSPSTEAILGYTEDESLLMDISSIVHPNDLSERQEVMKSVLANPGVPIKGGVKQMRHKNGSWRWIESIITNMLHDPAINGIVDNFRDVTEKKYAQEKLVHSELRLKQAQAVAHIGSWERDFATNITLWSEEQCKIFGVSPDEHIQSYESWLSFIHPDDVEGVLKKIEEAKLTFSSNSFYHRIRRRDGAVRHIHARAHFEFNKEGNPVGLYGIAHDVTEIKEAEIKLININRLYAFKSQLNQAIVQLNNEQTLFDEVCSIAVNTGKFELAWIGILDEQNRTINLLAQNNGSDNDIALFTSLPYGKNGPTENMLRTDTPYTINDYLKELKQSTWNEYAAAKGFKSSVILPLKKAGKTTYTLSLFSNKANFFNSEEIEQLKEVSTDISFALGVFEKERLRKDAEEKLKHRELRLRETQEIAHLGNWELDFSTGLALWSNEHCRIFGVSTEDNIHSYDSWISFVHPDDRAYVVKASKEGQASLKSFSFYHRIIRRDGATRYVYCHNHFEFNTAGIPVSLYGSSHDITEIKEAEEKIRNNESRLKQAQKIAHLGSWVLDFQSGIITWSEEACRIHGLSPQENKHTYQTWLSFIHPEDLDYVMETNKEAEATLSNSSFNHRIGVNGQKVGCKPLKSFTVIALKQIKHFE